jgi:hypothetical protein
MSANTMSDDWSSSNNAINALGSVLGYIGAEAATETTFTKLFWPQRAYAHYQPRHLLQLGLFCPAGGPLYKAALGMLDAALKNGLFKGRDQGHMLGTAFFPDSGCQYTLKSTDPKWPSHMEASRNNIWARVATCLRFPHVAWRTDDEKKAPFAQSTRVRARVVVCHLTLSVKPITKSFGSSGMDVERESDTLSAAIIFGILTTELTGILFTSLVAIVWKSWFAILWLLPLLLKLLSLTAAVKRQHLNLASTQQPSSVAQSFEVRLPAETGTFLVVTGPPALVLQFFRHYGHPERNRFCEVIQLGIAVAFGCLFPVGLVCSVAGMPSPIQYLWVSYQIYVVGVMYIARFLNVEAWASAEELIAEKLIDGQGKGAVHLWEDHTCGKFLACNLETSFHHSYREGRSHAESLQRACD